MTDNVQITAGSGTTIATDDVAGVQYQRVKLVDGTLDGTGAIGGDAANGLDVDVTRVSGVVHVDDNAGSLTVDGTVAATQSGTWNVGTVTTVSTVTNVVHVDDNGGNISIDDGGNSITVDGAVTVSGTATTTSTQTADLDTGAGIDTRAVVGLLGAKSGGAVLIPGDATKGIAVDLTATGANSTALKVDGSAVTQPVSAVSLPLPTGAASLAKQPALGTAGTASADVITVQGIAAMTALKVDGSAVTQPVSISGTVPVTAGSGVTRVQTQSSGLTTSVTAYSSGDQLGAEMTWANAAATAGGTFTIVSATLTDAAKLVGSADLFLFDRTGVSHAGDNVANAWSDADILKCLGVISFPPPIFSANNAIATIPYVGLSCKLNAGETTLYGVLVTRVGHTFFGAVTDLAVTLTIQKD